MADLYFKVNADYQELIRMQEEATKLKQALSNFSGTQQEFETLVDSLKKMEEQMQACAQAVSDGFTKINNGGLQEFDKSVLDLCESIDAYFGSATNEIDKMFSALQDVVSRIDKVKLAGADDFDLMQARQQVIELTESLTTQRSELERQKEAYKELADTISANFGKRVLLSPNSEQEAPAEVSPVDTSSLQETQAVYNNVRDAATEAMEAVTQEAKQTTDATDALNASLKRRVELTQASESLTDALSKYSGSKQEADTLVEPINRLEERLQSFSQSVSDCFTQVKDASINGLDQSISKVCENMDGNISNAISGIDQTLAALSEELERFGRLDITGANDIDLTPARQQISALMSDLMAQRDELEKQKEAYEKLAESINESIGTIKTPNTATASNTTEPTSPVSDTSTIEAAKDAYNDVRDAATEATEAATTGTEQVVEVTETLNSALERQSELAQEAVATGAEEEIAAQADAERELTEATKEAQAAAQETKNAHDELRNGIVEARNEIVSFKDVMNQSFGEMIEKAGGIKGISDTFKRTLNSLPTKQLEKVNTILERLKGTFTGTSNEAQGAANMVAQLQGENDKLVTAKNALAKVQEVVNGLEVAYEVLQKSSLLMLAVEDVKTWAVTKAKTMLGLATEGATTAQWSFNAAVAANPIGAFIEILVIAAGAIWAFCDALFGGDEELHKFVEDTDLMGQVISDLNDSVIKRTIDNTEKTMESFNKLRKSYNELGDDMEKKKQWIDDNAKALDKLHLNVDGVTEADNIFIKETPNVIAALKLQAEYAALTAVKFELLKQKTYAAAGIFESKARLYDTITSAEADALGIANNGEDVVLSSMEEVNAVNRARQKRVVGDIDASMAYLEEQQKKLEQRARIMRDYGNKYIDPDNKNGGGLMPKAFNSVEEEGEAGPNEKRKQKRERARANRGGGSRKNTKEDNYDASVAANRRAELLKQYSEKVIKATEKIEGDITKADIDFMAKGTDKQIASIRNNTQNQLKALEEEKKKLVAEHKKFLLELYLTTKGAKKNDAKYTEILNMSDDAIWKEIGSTKVQKADALVKAQEEERKLLEKAGRTDIMAELEKNFGKGNVNVVSRPVVETEDMLSAGYDKSVNSMADAFKDKEGVEREILYTPILPDGSVLNKKELDEYISGVVASGSSTEEILAADTKKLIVKVDAQVEDKEKLDQLQAQLYEGQQEAISKVYADRLTLGAEYNERQQQILKAGLNAEFEVISKAQKDALKSFDKYYDKQVSILRKYHNDRAKLEEQHKQGLINDSTYSMLKASIDQQEQDDLDKLGLDVFKKSPLYQMAMSGSAVDSDALQKVYDEMSEKMEQAAATMQPADFKVFMDAFTDVSDKMISNNPFKMLKDSVIELEEAEAELNAAHENTEQVYSEYGIDEFGREQQGGDLWQLRENEKLALQEVTDAENALNEARANGNSEELATAQTRYTNAIQNEAIAAAALTTATEKVQAAKNREANAINRSESAKKKEKKSTKEAVNMTKKWAGAIKDAADMFDTPIAKALSGIMSLTTTTLDSIEAIKESGYASAQGVARVAAAVQNAVAILAIIQAAWQVINSIMSLFSGNDEEEYKKRVDGLKAQVDALDYSFNALKEDMDEAWGTEAIDAYIKAVETLNERQKAQLELIKEQSKAHNGHHSLEYYQKKEANITDKELAEAKKRIAELGGDVSGEWITDWLYSLTAEQLAEFMKSGIGVTIMGKLGGVSGTGDYSGSDWLDDMQAFADTAKTVEDMADEMAEKLNGISLDGLKDEFKSLVTTFDTSLNDINNSFDEFMREGMYNNMRTKYDENMKGWYEELNELNKQRAEGMDEEEYRKRLAELRERYQQFVKQAQDEYQQSLTDAGINVKDIEQGATTGGFESMSEDTGTELNGRFAAMQAQETITAENTAQLVVLTGALHDIADEIRDVQVNSYLELREINENTKKVVEPILTMQEDIKRIKENTESL